MSTDAPSHLQALTLGQVSKLLAISEDTARRLCQSGKLRSVQVGIGGRRKARRVLVRDLETYLDMQSEPPAPPKRRRRDDQVGDYIK